jgi:nucleoside-diphosphate-sugar epimerase
MEGMTDVLVLGGTGWLSGLVAREWIARGARVTCLARGGRPAPEGAVLVAGDRSEPHAYDALAGHEWDEVVDVTYHPAHAASAVAALAGRARHWTYVSTVSVYADNDEPGADESAALVEPAAPGTPEDEYDYSRAKVAAEASVRDALGDRAAIVRPGLIVGPGDPTDRFGYWVSRFALAGDERVLVPDADGRRSQVIDVRDLAAFVVHVGESGWSGVANAVGPSLLLSAVLDAAAEVAEHTGERVVVSDTDLDAHDVAHWAGPRSLPLWLPRDARGFMTRTHDAYTAAGGRHRDLRDTLTDTLSDERARGLDRDRRAGLTRADELALLAVIGLPSANS